MEAGKKVTETEEFKILKRMLGEQTRDTDNFNIVEPKESKDIVPDSLQNLSDPDATYRFKYGSNIGYTANVVEIFDENGSIIRNYDLKPNSYSDKSFSSDVIEILSELYGDPNKPEQASSSVNAKINDKENTSLIQIYIGGAYYFFELAVNLLKKP